jgi:hypothetical protein
MSPGLKHIWSDNVPQNDFIYIIEAYEQNAHLYPWLIVKFSASPGSHYGALVGHGEESTLEKAKQAALRKRQEIMAGDSV